jgi:hypothetical protein
MSASVSWPEVIGTAAAVVAIGGGALGAGRGAMAWYRRSIGSRRVLAARLNQLAAGVTTRWVEERLGPPAFAGDFPVPPQQGTTPALASPSVFRELIYRTRHAWVQVLADENDTVARFSITVTDPRFRFQVRDLTFYQLHARLGHSRFSDVRTWAEPDGRSLNIAARRREYSESYWFGNPGNYQHYVLSYNEAGTGKFSAHAQTPGGWCQDGVLWFHDPPPVAPPPFDPGAPYARQFRAGTTVNTLTVLGPLMPAAGLAPPRGPDADYVRVLVPSARERRWLRRRVRRMNRQAEREINRQAEPGASSMPEDHSQGGATS